MLDTILILILLVIAIIILLIILRKKNASDNNELAGRINILREDINRIESSVKSEFGTNRLEAGAGASRAREEAMKSFQSFESKLNALTVSAFNFDSND